MSDSITKEHRSVDPDEVFERIRDEVRALLGGGIAPENISFALSYIATELGLAVATNPVEVYPVILSAVAQASTASSANKEDRTSALGSELQLPQSSTIH